MWITYLNLKALSNHSHLLHQLSVNFNQQHLITYSRRITIMMMASRQVSINITVIIIIVIIIMVREG